LSELQKQKWVIDANGIINIKQREREKAELEYFTTIPTTITSAPKEIVLNF